MRMFERETVWCRCIKTCALACGDLRNEVRAVRRRRIGAFASNQVDRVVLQVVSAGAGALISISHSATMLESPLAGGGDRAVDSTRAGGGGCHNTTVRRAETVGHLHHHR